MCVSNRESYMPHSTTTDDCMTDTWESEWINRPASPRMCQTKPCESQGLAVNPNAPLIKSCLGMLNR